MHFDKTFLAIATVSLRFFSESWQIAKLARFGYFLFWKRLISLSKMRDFMGKNSVNKVCISILNSPPAKNFKIEDFWFPFKSFCYKIFTNFPKKIGGVGKTEKIVIRSCRGIHEGSIWLLIGTMLPGLKRQLLKSCYQPFAIQP